MEEKKTINYGEALADFVSEQEYGAIIRKEPDGQFVYCFADVPAMEEWYMEKIRLRDFLTDLDSDREGGLQ